MKHYLIGDKAFYKCREITSVVIPESVTSICYSAFRGWFVKIELQVIIR